MFPIRDHNAAPTTPWVTWLLIAANVGLFLWSRVALNGIGQDYLVFQWGMTPARLSSGQDWITVLTAMFMHGGWVHIIGNMLFLWVFGDNLEDALGHLRYLLFYLACGVAAALAQYAVAPYAWFPVIGASGAIAGVLGGYILMFPRARIDVLFIFVIFFRIFPIPAWVVLGLWIALQLWSGTGDLAGRDGIAYWEHIGGFAAGLVLCLPAWWRRRNALRAALGPPVVKSTIPEVPR